MSTLNNTFAAVNDETEPDIPAPDVAAALGRPAVAGLLGVAGPSGPHLRRRRADGRAALRVQRRARDRADPGLRRPELGRRHQGHRRSWPRAELERTGGLERKVVAVATTTGTGWINEAEAAALEYMYNGDTAIV